MVQEREREREREKDRKSKKGLRNSGSELCTRAGSRGLAFWANKPIPTRRVCWQRAEKIGYNSPAIYTRTHNTALCAWVDAIELSLVLCYNTYNIGNNAREDLLHLLEYRFALCRI